jgi:hypothetical protein
MTKLKYLFLVFPVLCLCLVAAIGLPSDGQISQQKQEPQTQPDFARFPIIDAGAPQPTDPMERAKRAKKGKKHNIKYAGPIDESLDSMFLSLDWDVDLPALPIEKSAAVVIGRISKAEAHLSENRTGIYSEFTVQIEAIFKNDISNPLALDNSITVYRTGGRIRFPSGKILVSAVSHQDMPQLGSRYVLFLTRSSTQDGTDEDLSILTGYELKNGKVFPLDKVSANHPITKYSGVSENVLLTDLSSALVKPSQSLPIGKNNGRTTANRERTPKEQRQRAFKDRSRKTE